MMIIEDGKLTTTRIILTVPYYFKNAIKVYQTV